MATVRITHQTTYRHGAAASAAWQMLQLRPRDEAAQECIDFQLEISPPAPDLAMRTDYFGNTRHFFSLREPHTALAITSHSIVRRGDQTPHPLPGITLPLAAARAHVTTLIHDRGQFELEQYLHATTRVPLLADAAALAAGLDDTTPLLDWIEQLGRRFAETFAFDPTATDVGTPLSEVLQKKRGVCQDFSHLLLSCLRQHGLPAAYVSGYLLTNPPPGQPRLRGADAMHAWVSVFVPEVGWVDYDPTNTCFTGSGHIVVARGRDYSDVSPTRGVFTGVMSPAPHIGVTVEPVEE